MRGADIQQDTLFSTVIPEERVPIDHPLRPIREMVNIALKALDEDFNALYSELGRDSIPPEKLLSAIANGVLYDPQRASTDGADQLQPAVSLVCGFFDG